MSTSMSSCDETNYHLHGMSSPLRLDELSATTTGSNRIKIPSSKFRYHRSTSRRIKLVGASNSCNTTMSMTNITSLHDSNTDHPANMDRLQHIGDGHQQQLHRLDNERIIFASKETTTSSSKSVRALSRASRLYNKRRGLSLCLNYAMIVVIIVVAYFGYHAECSSSLQLAPTTPSSCPLARDCTCKWVNGKQAAHCERRNLRSIPTQLPPDTQVLDLSENNLNHIPQHIFRERHLTNLQKLYLSYCNISHIADEAFTHLTNLIELDLSHNHLQQVPTKSLEVLKYSLRRLTLSYNLIHVLDSTSFSSLSRLNHLDLSNNHMSLMKPNAFYGLTDLIELKLSENRLSQLPLNVVSDLRETVDIALFDNPWHCDCELRSSIDWMSRNQISVPLNPVCASPPKHQNIRWQNIKPEDFICPPVIINKHNELVVGAGSNVTLACTARGSPPLTFVWFQDEKNLTGRGSNNQTEPPPSTKLLEEKRYEIAEELGPPNVTTSILYLMNLKITDTSLFLCWVENAAGYTLGNFSLIVNDSPPAHLAGSGALDGLGNSLARLMGLDSSDTTSAQIAFVSLSIILVLIAVIVCLLVFKQMLGPRRPSKSSSPNDLKAQQANGKLSAASKFNHHQFNSDGNKSGGRMFASSDEDGASDEDEDANSSDSTATDSTSSCRKTGAQDGHPKVMAVNDLDGFIEHMRSGIINMDYHTMSPVLQFNNTLKKEHSSNEQSNRQHQSQQLSHLNHFPTASNSSTQPLFYNNKQPSNGSMATTMSDLSPSSGSASTSFATATNLTIPQQQYLAGASGTLRRQMIPSSMAQYSQQIHQQPPDIAATAYPIDYQGGYNIGVGNLHPQQQHVFMQPAMYDCDPSQVYDHQEQLLAQQVNNQHHQTLRPNSMNIQDDSYHQQPQAYNNQIRDSPNFL